ncbi:ABC transporter ATP-binding protein [Mameliella alba]|uniref:ABC transporter ATP-binding protein n=1 Tax=Mameliella alba TaxID=561184 RepID=UPI003159914C
MLHDPVCRDAALCIRNLSVSVEGRGVVQDASLCVPKGEIHGLLGPNGAGKTTLLRTLYRATRPASGRIEAFGREMDSHSHVEWAQVLGALVQSAGLLAGLTPRDIVEIGLEAKGLGRGEIRDRLDEALEIVGLTDKADQSADRLSGGELQRCYFAQLLACDPQVYVLDEPTNHLDLHYQLVLLDEVRRRGRTVLMCLHDLTLAMRYCHKVYLMQSGRIVASGAPATLLSRDMLMTHYRVDARFRGMALDVTGPV